MHYALPGSDGDAKSLDTIPHTWVLDLALALALVPTASAHYESPGETFIT